MMIRQFFFLSLLLLLGCSVTTQTELTSLPATVPPQSTVDETRSPDSMTDADATLTQMPTGGSLDERPFPTETPLQPLITPTIPLTPTPAPRSTERDGWLLYENQSYGYRLSYPEEYEVKTHGGIATGAPEGLPDEICVTFSFFTALLFIEPPAEPDGRFAEPCGAPRSTYSAFTRETSEFMLNGETILLEEFTNWENEDRPSSSPRALAFATLPDGNEFHYLFTGQATRGDYTIIRQTLIEMLLSYRPLSQPETAVSPSLPLFFEQDEDLWRASLDGTQLERITFDRVMANRTEDLLLFVDPPRVSPNGQYITFMSPNWALQVVETLGGRTIASLPATDDQIYWFPDNSGFIYVNNETLNLFSVANASAEPVHRANGPVFTFAPSVDFRFVAFECCFQTGEDYEESGLSVGRLETVNIYSGEVEFVAETTATVAGGTAGFCWTAEDTVLHGDSVTPEAECDLSQDPTSFLSPDSTQIVQFFLQSPQETDYFRHLRLVDAADASVVLWERTVEVTVNRAGWSADGTAVFVGNDFLPEPVLRLAADGSADPTIILSNVRFIGVIPSWVAAEN